MPGSEHPAASSPLYCISCGKPVGGEWCPEPCHTDLRDSNNRVTRGVEESRRSDTSSDVRKRFARALAAWLEEQGYNDADADAILRAIFDKVNSDAE